MCAKNKSSPNSKVHILEEKEDIEDSNDLQLDTNHINKINIEEQRSSPFTNDFFSIKSENMVTLNTIVPPLFEVIRINNVKVKKWRSTLELQYQLFLWNATKKYFSDIKLQPSKFSLRAYNKAYQRLLYFNTRLY